LRTLIGAQLPQLVDVADEEGVSFVAAQAVGAVDDEDQRARPALPAQFVFDEGEELVEAPREVGERVAHLFANLGLPRAVAADGGGEAGEQRADERQPGLRLGAGLERAIDAAAAADLVADLP